MNNIYYQKYIKYKTKYQNLKKQTGGQNINKNFTITSPNFINYEKLDDKYKLDKCGGQNIFPTLIFHDPSPNTKSYALIMDDPDAIHGLWIHFICWNIPKQFTQLDNDNIQNVIIGKNSWNENKYGGPCPPQKSGKHRYFFKVYALDTILNIDKNTNKEELLKIIKPYIIDQTEIVGIIYA